jgi:uncharacterized protein (DUF924 family)
MTHLHILKFWFEETTPAQRFKKDPDFDAFIKKRFEQTYWNILESKTATWRSAPEGRLAEIIVLDQFARNMFRDDAQAFAGDELALSLAEEAIAIGDDLKIPQEQRVFFYMPYMHSESTEVHTKALDIFKQYGNAANLDYEIKHKAIIDTFGRYPHRNKALGRTSTPEEIKWLEAGGGF